MARSINKLIKLSKQKQGQLANSASKQVKKIEFKYLQYLINLFIILASNISNQINLNKS